MPDIAGGYARIGEQIAGVGKQIGGAIVDFASAQGKKRLIDEIKIKYPTVVQAYPEDVLMQMDNKELGQRLAAVVGIENAIPKLKEIDPKFSTADIEQMKAEIFKQPDQARTIARDWMAIAEKNRQDSVNKESLAMVGGQPAQPAMPQVSAPQAPISDAELGRETADLLDPTKTVMPSQTSQSDLGQQLSAVDAERTPVMPAVSQKPRTRESIYGAISASGKIPDKETQEIIDKASRPEKDYESKALKDETIRLKGQMAKDKLAYQAAKDSNQNSQDLLKFVKQKEEDVKNLITKHEANIAKKKQENELLVANGQQPMDLSEDESIIEDLTYRADYWKQAAQEASAGGSGQGAIRKVDKTIKEKEGKQVKAAAKAYDDAKKGTGQPLFNQLTPEQQAIVIKRYNANK